MDPELTHASNKKGNNINHCTMLLDELSCVSFRTRTSGGMQIRQTITWWTLKLMPSPKDAQRLWRIQHHRGSEKWAQQFGNANMVSKECIFREVFEFPTPQDCHHCCCQIEIQKTRIIKKETTQFCFYITPYLQSLRFHAST